MIAPSTRVQRIYLALTLLSTLAASFIWGINTLFLLDAGLNNVEAFAANAFFTVGMVVFEVPTGVIADTWGRRISYLLGAATLLLSTLLYLLMWQAHASFLGWAISSILLGFGFTFFSGATQAWLVDALAFTGSKESLESVLARGQVVSGAAMLAGSLAGGFIAQVTSLGVPYIIRSVILGLTLVTAFFWMKDLGFTPDRSKGAMLEIRRVLRESIDKGWRNPPVRWLMLAGLCAGGVDIFAFYALQPYLLELYGDPGAFGVAGLAAAIVAGTQMIAGLIVPRLHRFLGRRTHILIAAALVAGACLAGLGLTSSFPVAIGLLIIWGLTFSIRMPIRQTYLNGIIPSQQRATVLSFDNLMVSAGGVIAQPALGRVADLSGYPLAYVVSAGIQLTALPFLLLARREKASSDVIDRTDAVRSHL
ncbi:MAG TPA: MFS transporter [Gemmatimonadales bacterium]|nr:MFS transporter [Gemmatimonadales bacterium]